MHTRRLVIVHARHAHAQERHASCPSCARARASSSMPSLPERYPLPVGYLLSSRERVPRHAHTPARLTSCAHPSSTHAMHRGGGSSVITMHTHRHTSSPHTHTHRQRVRVKVVGLEDDCVVGYEINLVVGSVCCWFDPPHAQIAFANHTRTRFARARAAARQEA